MRRLSLSQRQNSVAPMPRHPAKSHPIPPTLPTLRSPRHMPSRVLIALVALVLCAAVGGCASPGGASSTTARATATSGLPTPTPTTQDRLAALVRQAVGSAVHQVAASYDAQNAAVTVTLTVGGTVPNTTAKVSAAQDLVKSLCFQAEMALWTSGTTSGVPLREVTVVVDGPMQDEYADIIVDVYGVSVVEAQTAQRLDWVGLSAESAWGRYDRVFLRQSFVVVD